MDFMIKVYRRSTAPQRLVWTAVLGFTLLVGCTTERTLPESRIAAPSLGPELVSAWRSEKLGSVAPKHADGSSAAPVISPDGTLKAFASHRAARGDHLTPEARLAFAKDPHALDDIFIERTGGGGVRRLTRDAARNDQPVFSPDGKHISFTHHALDGLTAEIFSVSLDEFDLRRVTRLDRLSTHAAYHPGGAYLAFVSRPAAGAPAAVLVVDATGRHDPIVIADDLRGEVRVEFEAHGEAVRITAEDESGRRVRRSGRFNDRLARRKFGQKPLAPGGTARPRAWVEYLADPYFGGRPTGAPRERESNEAFAAAFRELGLTPVDKTFEMPFSFVSEIVLGEANDLELTLDGAVHHAALSADWVPTSISKTGEFSPAPIVFAGYGIVTPAEGPEPSYDAYGALDVTDKWVSIFAGLPTRVEGPRRFYLHQRGRMLDRALEAQARGAAGLLVFDDPAIPAHVPRLKTFGRPEGLRLPVLRLSRRQGEQLFATQGTSVGEWSRRLADGTPVQLTFPHASARASVDFAVKSAVARNVLGELKVPGATRAVLIGAYADGMGRGERGGSLDANSDVIHPGANANASGAAGVLALADRLTRRFREGTFHPKQNLIFAIWSAGEMGAMGSRNFAARRGVGAVVNLRAIGGDRPILTARGTDTSAEWPARLEATAADQRTTIYQVGPVSPDDAATFAAFQTPAVTLTAGPFASDRTSLDTPERVNYANLDKAVEFTERLVERLTAGPSPDVFFKAAR